MAISPLAQLLRQRLTRFPGLDPQAVLSVARQEGLGGGIGDNGTSFGPFQLHQGGAYPTSAPQQPGAAQAWATSPAGIDYALGRINQVAGGLKGLQAVRAIVSRFERPADPGREIAGAAAAYGAGSSSGRTPVSGTGGGGSTPSPAAQGNGNIAAALRLLGFAPPPAPRLPTVKVQGASSAQALAATLPRSETGTAIAKTALTQIGTPYQWGGPARLGARTDCSGLLQASAAANGVKIGRTTYEQWRQGIPVPLSQLQEGDAVFFHMGPKGPEHVAIYIGGGRVVEDPHTGASVEISRLAGRGAVGARRFG